MVKDLDSCNITDDYDDYALWLSRTDECAWYGVECDNSGVVTGLDLCKWRQSPSLSLFINLAHTNNELFDQLQIIS
jgi:hypothetical protein